MESEIILEMINVHKSFGDKEVLKGIDFSVHSGEIIGYIGSNGAGKSTTLKMILGILPVVEGEIRIFGEAISSENPSYKKRIGYVPENAELYDTLSAEEYLSFVGGLYGIPASEIDKKAKAMMEIMGIGDRYTHQISSFSKGMKQKTLIIASLLHNPDILFWDEPLNGLDANSVQIIKEILYQLKLNGKTIFYSSHIMDTVEKLSDRILLLNDGKVVADGPFETLKRGVDNNLEELFNQLTGFDEHEKLASKFISVMKEPG